MVEEMGRTEKLLPRQSDRMPKQQFQVLFSLIHIFDQAFNIFSFMCDDFEFTDITVGKNSSHGQILGQFRFQVDTVAFWRNQFNRTMAFIDDFEKTFYVIDVLDFHSVIPPFVTETKCYFFNVISIAKRKEDDNDENI